MSGLVVFGASCVVVGLAAGVLIGLWAPPPRRRGERVPEHPHLGCESEPFGYIASRHLRVVAPQAEPPCFIDAEALGWLEGA